MTMMLPPGFLMGPAQAQTTIGEITENLHRYLLDSWDLDRPPPRIEEDLSFVPKDREEVIYVYMYRAVQNTDLKNAKRFRALPFSVPNHENPEDSVLYYEWPPLYVDLYYLIGVHSKFRSDAERLLGWAMVKLHQATHLVYRPRRYLLPDGREVDSTGASWSMDNDGDGVFMDKVALAMVDDLTVGDAVNFFTIHEAPFRPYLTYQARCSMRGPLVAAPPTTVRALPLDSTQEENPYERPSGRMTGIKGEQRSNERRTPFGPSGFAHRSLEDNPEEEG